MGAPFSAALKRCSRCLLPETHETLVLDAEGVCNVCRAQEVKAKINWPERLEQLDALVAEYRGRYRYDRLVPFSDGNGSTWTPPFPDEALPGPQAPGGVHSLEQVQALLDRGADKVILNSAALEQPELINRVATAYGAQCVVLSLDAHPHPEGGWQAWSQSGHLDGGREALPWAREAVDRGAGEVMVTAIERDGTGQGLDLVLTAALAETLVVPVIASGGCGLAQHFVEGYKAGAAAVAAGTYCCQRDQNPMQCRSHIRNAGLPIRLEV